MAILTVPHFDLPFRWDSSGHAVTVEQDTLDDVSNCVEAIVRTIRGQRLELPEFGIDDLTFDNQPLQLQDIVDAVLEQELRAGMEMDQAPDQFDQMIARVRARVSITQEVSSD